MADAFTQQQEEPQNNAAQLRGTLCPAGGSPVELATESGAGTAARREGRLQGPACMEDIDFRAARGLDKQVVRSLINDSDWVRRHQHIFLVGPTGIAGKHSWRRPLDRKLAAMDSPPAYFATAAQLFRELELARADGSYAKRLRGLGQVDVLIVDAIGRCRHWRRGERRAFLEICDERYLTRSARC